MTEIHDQWTVFYEKRKNYFQFVFKQVVTLECWYEKKKIFSFSTQHLAVAVPYMVQRKSFIPLLAVTVVHGQLRCEKKNRFFSSSTQQTDICLPYMVQEKRFQLFLFQLSNWTFAVQICSEKRKSFEYWLRFCSFPTRYIGKTIFFF